MSAISLQDGDNFIRNVATIRLADGGCIESPRLQLRKGATGGLPVALEEIADHLSIDCFEDDIGNLINMAKAACAFIERRTAYVLLPTSYSITMSHFWSGGLKVDRGPLRGDPVLSYQETRDVWVDLPLDTVWSTREDRSFVSRLPGFDASVPKLWRPEDCVRLRFDCGFDSAEESGSGEYPIEDGLKMIMLLITGHYYKNREMLGAADAKNGLQAVELGATSILQSYRQYW
jgi:hypothetical protein